MFYKICKNKSPFNLFKVIPWKNIFLCYEKCWLYSADQNQMQLFQKHFLPICNYWMEQARSYHPETLKVLVFSKAMSSNLLDPPPRSFFNCYKHKGIRPMKRLSVGLSHLREHKFNHNFQNCINPLVVVVWISNQLLTFFLHCPYLMIKNNSPEHPK